MKHKTQDPKFYIENNRLVGQSGPVPEDEPLFIIRARDVVALDALCAYQEDAEMHGVPREHIEAIQLRINAFRAFSQKYPERMKVPDTSIKDLHDGKP